MMTSSEQFANIGSDIMARTFLPNAQFRLLVENRSIAYFYAVFVRFLYWQIRLRSDFLCSKNGGAYNEGFAG